MNESNLTEERVGGDSLDKAPQKIGAWARMQEKWGVSTWGVIAILLAFSAAGMTVLKISRPVIDFLIPADAPRWQWWTLRILVIVPVYEVLLLGYGTLFGQRKFFWDKFKGLGRLLARPFSRHS